MPLFEPVSDALIAGVRTAGDFLTDAGVTAVVDNWETSFKGLLTDNAPQAMDFINWIFSSKHHYVEELDLPFLNWFRVILVLMAYVVVIKVGQVIMSQFQPFKLYTFSIIHNTAMVLISAYMCIETVYQAVSLKYGLFGNYALDSSAEHGMAKIVWVFYMSKFPEMLDTVIMVLKKNNRQVSFLHMYHHFSIALVWCIVTFSYPAGEAYFSIILNSFVHVVMYSYYLARVFKIEVPWKFYITKFQMLQFMANMVQGIYDVYILKMDPVRGPTWLLQLLAIYMVSLLVLFGNYLRVNAGKAKKAKKAKSA
ncbi:polyunsaturated fatty acid elongation enzyme [Thecamonas trahens ATCC 50062]|uniref:Elongation of fatty acids protein n=1 Tax=Thecamonas trahens ATCC 50062 TaxID=461836 RepID=A0A0L0D5X0_THETB|nr:polyunsaturated fatty acid elongation enzyme [Thecamonas trahens ATCC 50062]KNC47782.1 polyunsaturated fatty acid elongation enzyme [Thecamonas trahens ATCC 50062]|eukprot:XP_013759260.1 polyunsaturated fatty acid elongation enzyme [Thecamonas trahens ATCC 50062]